MRACSRKTFFDEQGCFGVKVWRCGGGISVDAFSVETPVVGFAGDGLILHKRQGSFFRDEH